MACPIPRRALSALGLALASAAGTASAQALPAQAATPTRATLLCAADQPLLYPGETVVLRAWIIGAADERIAGPSPSPTRWQWRWHSSLGSVQGDDVATWRFGPGERPDQGNTITAIVEATSGDPAQTLRCEVDILLTDRPEASAGESRGIRNMQAAFLLRGQAAPAGYGMYSYLLLRTPFDDAEARRNIQATAMYLQAMWATARLRLSIAENQLNLVLLPLQRSVAMPTELMRPDEALAMATEVVKFYDYAHAQVLLSDFCITASAGGPYLVASPERGGCRRNRVLLDLTKAEPYLLPYWIRTFLSLAAAERSWANDTMTLLLLNTRNVIASSYGGAATAAQGLSQSLLMLDARR